VFVDEAGFVAEAANANLAAILRDGTLVTPPFTHALEGLTMQRALELLPAVSHQGGRGGRGRARGGERERERDAYAPRRAAGSAPTVIQF
jgi:hypothetical protein